jgi:hypothetical protein
MKSLVYMVHFVSCTAASRIIGGRPASLIISMESGYRPKIELIMHEAMKNKFGQWPEKQVVFQRIAPFLSTALELDMLCRSLINERVNYEEFNNSFKTRRQRMSEAVYSYTEDKNVSLEATSRIRLNLGLVVLSLVERDFATRPKELRVGIVNEMIKDIFLSPFDINLKDLIMALIVVGDYARYYEDATEVLKLMMEHIDDSARLAMAVLDSSDLRTDLKMRLSYKWRRLNFIHELEMMPKMLLTSFAFLRPDPPACRYRVGPWLSPTYQRYEHYLMIVGSGTDQGTKYTMEDVEFSRNFLRYFLPWFLKSRYISKKASVGTSTVDCYLRPKLGLNSDKMTRVLAQALGTALMIDVRFQERLCLADSVVEDLQTIWSTIGAGFLSISELGDLLSSGHRSPKDLSAQNINERRI